MKVKTSKLSGLLLDWAVAKCEGLDPFVRYREPLRIVHKDGLPVMVISDPDDNQFVIYLDFTSDWNQGGPIIEREKIDCDWWDTEWAASRWATKEQAGTYSFGPTPLVAAMRCYVESKLGHEVEIPEELNCGFK